MNTPEFNRELWLKGLSWALSLLLTLSLSQSLKVLPTTGLEL